MADQLFPGLFSPLEIRGKVIRNRILSTGHDTTMPTDATVNDALIAYHKARAKGGAGLIITQVAGVHETARYTSHMLMATDDECVDGYRRLADACHAEGCAVFSQLFHPGREIMESSDGLLPVAYAPSVSPNERFHVMPRALDQELIKDIIDGYGSAARRMYQAGLDGVEFVASHGYLPAQFLNPRVNLRTDEYGGSLDNRLRFFRQALVAMRTATGDDFVIGMRISADERDEAGLVADEVLECCIDLEPLLDYVNVTAGTSASVGGAIHIVPPMAYQNAYLSSDAKRIKDALTIPVFVAGRINQPHEAEAIIASGSADMCGMTRALICDPEMPNKARENRPDDIRACIACNQACIGHFHRGYPISCIQHPETGRELRFGSLEPARPTKNVMIVGGGPAGMKAAITAAKRGHQVTLYEAESQLGGQAKLAQLLPRRAEFGGIITNLSRELEQQQVRVVRGVEVDRELVAREAPDVVILATGARPYVPELPVDDSIQVVDAWQILRKEVKPGRRVVIADWRGDWIAPGLAEMLAKDGSIVELALNGTNAGAMLPLYVRDNIAAELHKLQVRVTPYARVYGADTRTVYMQHTASGEPIIFEDMDMLILCLGHRPVDGLKRDLAGLGIEVHMAGDCLAPRTAEEAVYDGLKIGAAL
ncbi:2,4-dienoyl-CoA reductase-like NADH-dependent reductase (Old Yellow Enzyme family) [Mesorhizobium sp. YL-MeA3-2017]|jgi:2,4-dienoyl-CoA reductase-like NADH-dependent reductase (Old Yellow Enzyme family)|uniref:oxidoreductase n=1 Tax=Mesorhizobium sp. YL-MeA3-2017 TaxID=3042284 RepID=UPI0015CD27FA|nr:FAD-dependent oxidoreductase [Mesorhizobium sp. YL-MeA3-2017]MDQ0333034.1 2,4-dienoyl-CoA reductase-like NADH-dependent reductase (Old Yellow Enzyme family) [Mesorhizobium sp. YL-MeA3-2017]